MPAICISDLRDAIPRNYGTNIYSNPFRYPQLRHMRLSYWSIEIIEHGDRRQLGIEWIRTGFGRHRPIFVCSCGYGAIRLFARYGTYACKACHGAVHTCQRLSRRGRKRLRASMRGWPPEPREGTVGPMVHGPLTHIGLI